MSATPQAPRDDDDERRTEGSPEGRRRARVLIPAVFVGLIVLIFLFIFLVSQLNR